MKLEAAHLVRNHFCLFCTFFFEKQCWKWAQTQHTVWHTDNPRPNWDSYSIIPPPKTSGNSFSKPSWWCRRARQWIFWKKKTWAERRTAEEPRQPTRRGETEIIQGVSLPLWNTESSVLRSSSCHKVPHLMTHTHTHAHSQSAISSGWSIRQSKHSHF